MEGEPRARGEQRGVPALPAAPRGAQGNGACGRGSPGAAAEPRLCRAAPGSALGGAPGPAAVGATARGGDGAACCAETSRCPRVPPLPPPRCTVPAPRGPRAARARAPRAAHEPGRGKGRGLRAASRRVGAGPPWQTSDVTAPATAAATGGGFGSWPRAAPQRRRGRAALFLGAAAASPATPGRGEEPRPPALGAAAPGRADRVGGAAPGGGAAGGAGAASHKAVCPGAGGATAGTAPAPPHRHRPAGRPRCEGVMAAGHGRRAAAGRAAAAGAERRR